MKKLEVSDFSLEHTINSGQFFLYEKIGEFFYITISNKIFKIKQEENLLFYDNIETDELVKFLGLDEDLKKLTSDFDDEHLILALEKYWGLRILKQNLWQCIIGFLCSQCSNIHKIKTNMKLISKLFGEKVLYENMEFYTFPKPGKIDDLNKLKEAKVGYRAEYILRINELVKNTNFLEKLRKANYSEAKNMLVSCRGIGEKVAECICLYALGHKEAFPIDTWIKQTLEEIYIKRRCTNKELCEFIDNYFGENKGLKQQYLFHWARLNLK